LHDCRAGERMGYQTEADRARMIRDEIDDGSEVHQMGQLRLWECKEEGVSNRERCRYTHIALSYG
jgi:hypothetical protein